MGEEVESDPASKRSAGRIEHTTFQHNGAAEGLLPGQIATAATPDGRHAGFKWQENPRPPSNRRPGAIGGGSRRAGCRPELRPRNPAMQLEPQLGATPVQPVRTAPERNTLLNGRDMLALGVQASQTLEQQHHREHYFKLDSGFLSDSRLLASKRPAAPEKAAAAAAPENPPARGLIRADDRDRDILSSYLTTLHMSLQRGSMLSGTALEKDVDERAAADCELAKGKWEQQQRELSAKAMDARAVLDKYKAGNQQEEAEELRKKVEQMGLQRLGKSSKVRVPLPELTEADYDEYERLTCRPERELLVSHGPSNIDIRGHDMATLAHCKWLNDEVINLCMSMLQERDTRRRKLGLGPTCHFFNSFFLNKLYKDEKVYNYKNVLRWTTPKKLKRTGQASSCILDCDRIIIPCNQGNMHWTCVVVDLKNSKLASYDSFGGADELSLAYVAQYIKDEYKDKRNEEREDVLEWPREYPEEIPRQTNGFDCGVFSVMFAEYLGLNAELDFRQENMLDFRVRIARDIMRLKVD